FDRLLEQLGARDDVRGVVLPRTPDQAERIRAMALPSLAVPESAVDGQSLVAGADLVISAGGTMNREAVVLGPPVDTTFARGPGRRRRAAGRRGPAASSGAGRGPGGRAKAGGRAGTGAPRSRPADRSGAGRPRASLI